MSMVGYMRWERRKKTFFLLAVSVPLLVGLTAPFVLSPTDTSNVSDKVDQVYLERTCFDKINFFIQTTKKSGCPQGFIFLGNAGLTESASALGIVEEIHPLLLLRFNTASLFAAQDGVTLAITSGFRSLERQGFLYQREVNARGSETEAAKWVLPPQSSNHPKGLAIDVNYPMDREGARWLEINGWRFGLCRVYANEWWHFEAKAAPGVKCPPLAPDARVDLG
jgi:D-alanyl-D-alanine carboxypeptidase